MSDGRRMRPEAQGPSPGDSPRRSLRILLITSDWPLLTTGRLRQVHLLRGLGRRHRVRLVSLADPGPGAADLPSLEGTSEVIAVPGSARLAGGRRAWRWFGRMRASADREIVALAAAARRAAEHEPVDVMLVAGRELGPVLTQLPRVPLVLDLCDARSIRLRGEVSVAPAAARPLLLLRYLAERRYERALLARAGHVIVASERDREALGSAFTPISVVGNGVDIEFWSRDSPALGTAVLFSGAMDYAPNVDAAIHLATVVMPLVQARRPTAHLIIVGRDPTPAVRALTSHPGVTVTGTVEDVRPFLERAGVFCAPLRFAAGIQNKLLEAMAMSIPVVTTPIAAAGLSSSHAAEPPIRVADGPAALAAAVLAALERRDADPEPDTLAREYVRAGFSWSRATGLLEEILLAAVKDPE